MNDTVARIVEILFQDIEITDEVASIRDEVMYNCQERFNDLVSSGMDEDNAIAAVVESLKGMEDVLAPYKKKPAPKEEGAPVSYFLFQADEVQQIDLTLVNEDVNIEVSEDEMYHVKWDTDVLPLVQCNVANGVMKIDRKEGEDVRKKESQHIHINIDQSDMNFDGLGDAIDSLTNAVDSTLKAVGAKLRNLFSGKSDGLQISMNFGGGSVTVQIPEGAAPAVKLLTTSGDLNIGDVALGALTVTTTSGDVEVNMAEESPLPNVTLRTTSGDIDASLFADEAHVSTISGDAEVEGRIGALHTGTTSGDITVRADVVRMQFKSISGDVELTFDSNELREVSGSTISGDIEVELPAGMGTMAIRTQTRSGDTHTHCATSGVGPTVSGSITSISGDIDIS